MTELQRALSISGESVERIYDEFRSRKYLVNRRYQRKLVWSIDEKRSFIDSIAKGYPIPLILLADHEVEGVRRYEIIDGMQRLNAIMAFIEGDFSLDGRFFDLDAMATTKEAVDQGILNQREPRLPRHLCTKVATYQVPVSVYEFTSTDEIDEVFQRVNAFGRHLSRQELRWAAGEGVFPDLVRHIAESIRGDVSATDVLLLNDMTKISVTSRDLPYGIDVDQIFWVAQNILTREQVRQSLDEQVIADTLGFILLEPKPESSQEALDSFFRRGRRNGSRSRFDQLQDEIAKKSPDVILHQYLAVYDELRKVLVEARKPFNQLMFPEAPRRVPRYFQAVFLAFYELLVDRNKKVTDYGRVAAELDGIGKRFMEVGGGGGRWGATERQQNVRAVGGVIEPFFADRSGDDPALDSWVTKFENVLVQSYTEQDLYDFKQGFHKLGGSYEFDGDAFSKAVLTLCAMANKRPGAVGYVLVGVTDDEGTKERIREAQGVEATSYDRFFVVGIDHEAERYGGVDEYFRWLIEKVQREPIPEKVRDELTREVRLPRYFDKSVLVLQLAAQSEPVPYGGQFFERRGSSNEEVVGEGVTRLVRRFLESES